MDIAGGESIAAQSQNEDNRWEAVVEEDDVADNIPDVIFGVDDAKNSLGHKCSQHHFLVMTST